VKRVPFRQISYSIADCASRLSVEAPHCSTLLPQKSSGGCVSGQVRGRRGRRPVAPRLQRDGVAVEIELRDRADEEDGEDRQQHEADNAATRKLATTPTKFRPTKIA
jgi:hypothetical protein